MLETRQEAADFIIRQWRNHLNGERLNFEALFAGHSDRFFNGAFGGPPTNNTHGGVFITEAVGESFFFGNKFQFAMAFGRHAHVVIGRPTRMPKLACWSCGRQIYTVAPLESLFAEERRCPRCGANLNDDRRALERRSTVRRQNLASDPGPPEDDGERRLAQRRTKRRRGNGGSTPGAQG